MADTVLVTGNGLHSYAPKGGGVSRKFVQCLVDEFNGIRERCCNTEHPVVFMGVILQTTPGALKAHEIH